MVDFPVAESRDESNERVDGLDLSKRDVSGVSFGE